LTGLAVALLLAAAGAAAAQGPGYVGDFRWEASSGTVLIGSRFEIKGVISFPEEWELRGLDAKDADTGHFELLQVQAGDRKFEGGLELRPVILHAAVFSLGEQTLPPLGWTLRGADGTIQTLRSPPLRVIVMPPRPGLRDTGDIRKIKGPFEPRVWPWAFALLLLFAAGAAAAYRYWRSRSIPVGTPAEATPVDHRTPEQAALDELDALLGLGLPAKEFYDRVSDIVRLYLEKTQGFPALSMTTTGLQRRLIWSQADPQARSLLKVLLSRCDLAKFARFMPKENERALDVEKAKKIVHRLTPDPDEGTEPAAVSGAGSKAGTP